MKKIVAFIFMMVFMINVSLGQTDHAYNFYGQLFGGSTRVAVGFDSRFKPGGILGYSAGIGFTSISYEDSDGKDWNYTYMDVDSKGLSIPLEVNAILGNRASKFELGLGMTAFLVSRDELHHDVVFFPTEQEGIWDYTDNSYRRKVFRPNIIGTLNIGYRLQRKSGFFMKLGLTFLIGDIKCSPIDGLARLPNICLGYTIPHF